MIIEELIHIISFKLDRGSINAIQGAIRKIKNMAMTIATTMTAALTTFFGFIGTRIVKTIANVESLEVAFTTMLKGVGRAKQFMQELFQFVKETPFEIANAFGAARKLLAVGFKREGLIDELRMVGDIASGLQVPLGQLVKAYGDVRTKGRLMGQEMLQFQNAGVGLTEALAKTLKVNIKQIPDMMAKARITFENVRDALRGMTGEGGLFFNMMKKQSQTIGGLWSNLMDTITLSFLKFRSTWEPILKSILNYLIGLVDTVQEMLTPAIVRVLTIFGTLMTVIGPGVLAVIGAKIILIVGAVSSLVLAVSALIEEVMVWARGGDSLIGALFGSVEDFKKNFGFIISYIDRIKIYINDTIYEIKSLIGGIFTGNELVVNESIDRIFSNIEKILDEILVAIMRILDSPVFQKFIAKLGLMILRMLYGVFLTLNKLRDKFITTAISEIGKAILNILRYLFSGVDTWLSSIADGFKRVFTDTIADVKYMGKFLGLDFLSGNKSVEKAGKALANNRSVKVEMKTEINNQIDPRTPGEVRNQIMENSKSFYEEANKQLTDSILNNFPLLER